MEWFFRTASRLTTAAIALFAVAASVLVYLCILSLSVRHRVEQFAAQAFTAHSAVMYLAATLLLVLVLVLVWASLSQRRLLSRALLINTTEGSVRISSAMLSRFIKHIVQGCDGVRAVSIQTIPDRRKMTVIASVTVSGQTPVSIIAGRLQHQVRHRVTEVFGVDLLRDIRIEITGVAAGHEAPRGLLPWRAAPVPPVDPPAEPPAEPPADAAPVLASS